MFFFLSYFVVLRERKIHFQKKKKICCERCEDYDYDDDDDDDDVGEA
jgi:hypothetical protein